MFVSVKSGAPYEKFRMGKMGNEQTLLSPGIHGGTGSICINNAYIQKESAAFHTEIEKREPQQCVFIFRSLFVCRLFKQPSCVCDTKIY